MFLCFVYNMYLFGCGPYDKLTSQGDDGLLFPELIESFVRVKGYPPMPAPPGSPPQGTPSSGGGKHMPPPHPSHMRGMNYPSQQVNQSKDGGAGVTPPVGQAQGPYPGYPQAQPPHQRLPPYGTSNSKFQLCGFAY